MWRRPWWRRPPGRATARTGLTRERWDLDRHRWESRWPNIWASGTAGYPLSSHRLQLSGSDQIRFVIRRWLWFTEVLNDVQPTPNSPLIRVWSLVRSGELEADSDLQWYLSSSHSHSISSTWPGCCWDRKCRWGRACFCPHSWDQGRVRTVDNLLAWVLLVFCREVQIIVNTDKMDFHHQQKLSVTTTTFFSYLQKIAT